MDRETQQSQSNQTRIQLSLAALMFFSPLVQNVIKKNFSPGASKGNMELTQEDTDFIK